MTSKLLPNTRTSSHHKFWTEFFMLYKSLPALWNTRCEEYKDRYIKSKACDEMVAKLSEFKPNCNRRDVLRQINIFRTNYRRERARIEERKLHCKDFHKSLWYYNLLSFLDNQERRGKAKKPINREEREDQDTSLKIIEDHTCSEIEAEENEIYEYVIENELEHINNDQELHSVPTIGRNYNESGIIEELHYETYNEDTDLESSRLETNQYASSEYMLTNRNEPLNCEEETLPYEYDTGRNILTESLDTNREETIHNDIVSPIVLNTVEHIASLRPLALKSVKDANTMTGEEFSCLSNNSNSSEILAQSWALQYDEMSMEQKIYARKAIADILFAGCMGRLGTHQESVSINTANETN